MRHIGVLLVVLSILALAACAPEETPVAGTTDSTPVASADPLSGSWTGDWGPAENHRNPVTIALTWDGATLSGTVNPGPNAVPITKGSFAQDTGVVTMEASAPGSDGKTVHYTVEGKLAEGAMTGTWIHDDKKGDFKITKS